jgi:hypothetical protein
MESFRNWLSFSLLTACCMGLTSCSTTPPIEKTFLEKPTVYYSGVWFAGSNKSIPDKFDLIFPLFQDKSMKLQEEVFKPFFEENALLCENINLVVGELAPGKGSQYLLALVLSNQWTSINDVSRGDSPLYDVDIDLVGYLLIVDFREKTIVAAYPQNWGWPFPQKHKPKRSDIRQALAKELRSDYFLQKIRECLPELAVLSASASTLQVKDVAISDKPWSILSKESSSEKNAYEAWIAENLSQTLSDEFGVPVVPYQKDKSLADMSLMISDGSMQNFKLSPGTFAIDIELNRFRKVKAQENSQWRVWLNAAYVNTRLYEPEFDLVFYEGEAIGKAMNKVPVYVDLNNDIYAYEQSIRDALKEVTIALWEDKDSRKVIEKCQK